MSSRLGIPPVYEFWDHPSGSELVSRGLPLVPRLICEIMPLRLFPFCPAVPFGSKAYDAPGLGPPSWQKNPPAVT